MKRLSPSLRKKRRYIAFEVISVSKLDPKEVKGVIWQAILRVFGEVGGARIDPYLVEDTWKENRGIIRCSHNATDSLLSVFTFIESVGQKNATFQSLGITNTIERAKKLL